MGALRTRFRRCMVAVSRRLHGYGVPHSPPPRGRRAATPARRSINAGAVLASRYRAFAIDPSSRLNRRSNAALTSSASSPTPHLCADVRRTRNVSVANREIDAGAPRTNLVVNIRRFINIATGRAGHFGGRAGKSDGLLHKGIRLPSIVTSALVDIDDFGTLSQIRGPRGLSRRRRFSFCAAG